MTAPKRKAKPSPAKKRQRVDWEAIERDFRTGKFSQVELCSKHGVAEATLSRRIKADQAADKSRWQKDLTEAVRQATNAALMTEMVKTEIKAGQEQVNLAVKAAAEVNKQVILQHRGDIRSARDVAVSLLAELQESAMLTEHKDLLTAILAGEGAEPRDELEARKVVMRALDLGNRVGSMKALAEALTKLQGAERKAFALDEASDDGADGGDFVQRMMNARARAAAAC